MPSPTVAASDSVRISRAGCSSGGGRSGACKIGTPAEGIVAGPLRLAQPSPGNGVLPAVQWPSADQNQGDACNGQRGSGDDAARDLDVFQQDRAQRDGDE